MEQDDGLVQVPDEDAVHTGLGGVRTLAVPSLLATAAAAPVVAVVTARPVFLASWKEKEIGMNGTEILGKSHFLLNRG